MKTLTGRSLIRVLAGLILLAAAVEAHAGPKKIREDARRKNAGVSTTVEYSGSLAGTMSFGGVRYRLAPNASVYVLGSGLASPNISVDGASLYLSGDKRGDVVLVRSVIVRPAATSDVRSGRGHTGKVSKGAAF